MDEEISRLKTTAVSLLNDLGCNGSTLTGDLINEMCRYGAAELHAVAAYVGGVASQEIIKTEEKQVQKYSPLLESPLVSENNVSTAKFKTIPDIWRSSAEKFGDRIALVDPHHDPPTNMTYKQVEQDVLDFSEGLRVIGIKPTEKIALFADNSCRWLIADQGSLHSSLRSCLT